MNCANHSSASNSAEECAVCAKQHKCQACFEELVRRFQTSLLQYVIGRGHSRHDAEDVVQETFLLAYRNLQRYDATWRFGTWLFTIAHRQTISSWRKRQTQPDTQPVQAMDAAMRVDPLREAMEKESRNSLWYTAQEILSEEAFAGLWLSYVEAMSADEIGQVLGRNANAVRILLYRARVRLGEELAQVELSGEFL